jgi:hypothetical protein
MSGRTGHRCRVFAPTSRERDRRELHGRVPGQGQHAHAADELVAVAEVGQGLDVRGAQGTTIGEEVKRIAEVRQLLQSVNLGATAIGTTVTAARASSSRWRRT